MRLRYIGPDGNQCGPYSLVSGHVYDLDGDWLQLALQSAQFAYCWTPVPADDSAPADPPTTEPGTPAATSSLTSVGVSLASPTDLYSASYGGASYGPTYTPITEGGDPNFDMVAAWIAYNESHTYWPDPGDPTVGGSVPTAQVGGYYGSYGYGYFSLGYGYGYGYPSVGYYGWYGPFQVQGPTTTGPMPGPAPVSGYPGSTGGWGYNPYDPNNMNNFYNTVNSPYWQNYSPPPLSPQGYPYSYLPPQYSSQYGSSYGYGFGGSAQQFPIYSPYSPYYGYSNYGGYGSAFGNPYAAYLYGIAGTMANYYTYNMTGGAYNSWGTWFNSFLYGPDPNQIY